MSNYKNLPYSNARLLTNVVLADQARDVTALGQSVADLGKVDVDELLPFCVAALDVVLQDMIEGGVPSEEEFDRLAAELRSDLDREGWAISATAPVIKDILEVAAGEKIQVTAAPTVVLTAAAITLIGELLENDPEVIEQVFTSAQAHFDTI